MKLEEIVTVKVGINISRVNELDIQTLEIYTYEDLTDDLNGLFLNSTSSAITNRNDDKDVHLSESGDVIFSFVSSKAAIVSKKNAGKIMNQNFAKLIIEHEQLDKSYLCYLLNELPTFALKKQMAISMQGSTIPKLTPAILKDFEIKLPNLEKQKTIGKAYLTLMKHQTLVKQQAELEKKFYLEVLKKLNQ